MKKLAKNSTIFKEMSEYIGISAKSFAFMIIFLSFLPYCFSLSNETEAQEERKIDPGVTFQEKITVVGRLPVDDEDLSKVPSSVTIITPDEIEASGARTLQELLADIVGTVFFDDIGNGVETTIDLRGFNEGTAAAVLLDGVRINEPDDNRVNFEQIPLSAIEKIEIYRGSSSSTLGAGALSGTINIVTRLIPVNDFMQIESSYGTHGTSVGKISGGIDLGRTGILLDASRERSEGFRENSDYRISSFFIKMGGSYERPGDLSLSFLYNKSRFGAPGALTAEEMENDRDSTPYNKVDGGNEELRQLSFNITRNLPHAGHLSANLFYRENAIDTLTTGRWLMGFETESVLRSTGFVSQYSCSIPVTGRELSILSGVEAQSSSFSSTGYFTDAEGTRFSSSPDSSNDTDLLRIGLFLQGVFTFSPHLSALAGIRYDRDDLDYHDLILKEVEGDTTFSELSFKGGINLNPSDTVGFFVLYSQAFLPPTVYDLFAFPLFGSNPDLKPSRAQNYELGMRVKWNEHATMQTSFFSIDVKDEVVFVIIDPETFIGMNQNVGKSRRYGLEIESTVRISERLAGFLNYTRITAELKSGKNRGKGIPLVPESKASAGISFAAGKKKDYLIRLSGSYVGSRYLTGDDSNSLQPLVSYTLFNARIAKKFKNFQLFVEGRNLLDEEYETRGITNGFDLFFTPAPGMTFAAGIEWNTLF